MPEPAHQGKLGASGFALAVMVADIEGARGAETMALGISDPSKAEIIGAFIPWPRVHASHGAPLDDPEIKAAHVPVQCHMHIAWVLWPVEPGKHDFCKKPIAAHASGIDRLVAARGRSGLLVAAAFMIAHHPRPQGSRDHVQGSATGRLINVTASFGFDVSDPEKIRNCLESGGSSLRDIALHNIVAARFASKEVMAVTALQIRRENGVDAFTVAAAQIPGLTFAGFTSVRMNMRQAVASTEKAPDRRRRRSLPATSAKPSSFSRQALKGRSQGRATSARRLSRAANRDLRRCLARGPVLPLPEFSPVTKNDWHGARGERARLTPGARMATAAAARRRRMTRTRHEPWRT
jgi:predicted dehydrogenase